MSSKSAAIARIIVFSAIFLAALITSITGIILKKADNRFVLLFEMLDDNAVHVETRYINTVPGEDDITCFIKELLLGPSVNRYRPLFPRKTTLEDCFMRNGVLYINLSGEALLQSGISSETERACTLLKENVRSNFKQVEDIQIFISGIEAYREEEAFTISVE